MTDQERRVLRERIKLNVDRIHSDLQLERLYSVSMAMLRGMKEQRGNYDQTRCD